MNQEPRPFLRGGGSERLDRRLRGAPSIRPGRSATTKVRPSSCHARRAAVAVNDAEIRLERGERIVGDFRARGKKSQKSKWIFRHWETDQADIREKF